MRNAMSTHTVKVESVFAMKVIMGQELEETATVSEVRMRIQKTEKSLNKTCNIAIPFLFKLFTIGDENCAFKNTPNVLQFRL